MRKKYSKKIQQIFESLKLKKKLKKIFFHTYTKRRKYQSKKDQRTPRTHYKETLNNNKNAQE
jgi:hypothetical protein